MRNAIEGCFREHQATAGEESGWLSLRDELACCLHGGREEVKVHLLFLENSLGLEKQSEVFHGQEKYTFRWRFVRLLRLLKTPNEQWTCSHQRIGAWQPTLRIPVPSEHSGTLP